MTTFHEPQPQSRRAARQSERGENPESPSGFAHKDGVNKDGQRAQGQYIVDSSGGKRETWDTVARRAAQLPTVAATEAPDGDQQESAGEPLTYATQARPQIPSYDGLTFRNRVGSPPADEEQPDTESATPEQEAPAFRVRDFSPAARAAPVLSPQWPAPAASATVPAVDLEYQTQAAAPSAGPVAPLVVHAPVADAPSLGAANPAPERELTRRELRALREQQESVAALDADVVGESPAIIAPPQNDSVSSAPVQDVPVHDTPAAELVTVAEAAPGGDEVASVVESVPAIVSPIVPAPVVESAPVISALDAAEEALIEGTHADAQEIALEPPRPANSYGSPPPLVEPLVARLSASGIPQESPVAAVPAPTEPPAYAPPIGHWSLQATIDDETQPYESTINRTIGSAGTTTNALVLPSIPQASDMGPALTSTGEILLTGSIDVPHSLASTGAHPTRFDDPGIDKLFDFSDGEGASTDSAPVRAISAVSTHTSTHAVINTKKPQSNRMLTALLISASVMAVGVVGLLIASVAFNLF